MIALLMQKYRFYPATNFKPKVIAGISLVSKNGIRIRVEPDPADKYIEQAALDAGAEATKP